MRIMDLVLWWARHNTANKGIWIPPLHRQSGGYGGRHRRLPCRFRTSLRAIARDWTSAGSSNPVPGGTHGHVCSSLPGTRW